jgi:hypothetical protein
MDEKELIVIVSALVKTKFGNAISTDNILEIIAIAMNVVENRLGVVSGDDKKKSVISIVKYYIISSAQPKNITKLLEYVDNYADASIDLVIWLSRNKDIVKNINKSVCCRPFLNTN